MKLGSEVYETAIIKSISIPDRLYIQIKDLQGTRSFSRTVVDLIRIGIRHV